MLKVSCGRVSTESEACFILACSHVFVSFIFCTCCYLLGIFGGGPSSNSFHIGRISESGCPLSAYIAGPPQHQAHEYLQSKVRAEIRDAGNEI